MKSVCLYFQVHQPFRLRTYRFFDIGKHHHYFDDYANRFLMQQVAGKCYLPANKVLMDLIMKYGKDFKVSFSISGTALDQFEVFAPDVLESFRVLAETGNVEFLAETHAHSLAALKSRNEFNRQVTYHSNRIKSLFGQTPTTFRNTELVYSNDIGDAVYDMGYQTMITEGAKHVLGRESPNRMYCSASSPELKLLLKNFQLSDDIAFRFSNQNWSEWPLTPEKYVGWLKDQKQDDEVVNLFMDYETFGEHQWAETGIFDFLKGFPAMLLENTNIKFTTPSELANTLTPHLPVNIPDPISWADEERDLTAWLGNEMQKEAFTKVYSIENKLNKINDPGLYYIWQYLQTSDHFYYMCTKWFSDGAVHRYFNPYSSPYEAFINYMNVLSDFITKVDSHYDSFIC